MLLSSRQEAVDISLLKKEQREGVDMLVGWRVGIWTAHALKINNLS